MEDVVHFHVHRSGPALERVYYSDVRFAINRADLTLDNLEAQIKRRSTPALSFHLLYHSFDGSKPALILQDDVEYMITYSSSKNMGTSPETAYDLDVVYSPLPVVY